MSRKLAEVAALLNDLPRLAGPQINLLFTLFGKIFAFVHRENGDGENLATLTRMV